jgi:ferrous iron transport protein A
MDTNEPAGPELQVAAASARTLDQVGLDEPLRVSAVRSEGVPVEWERWLHDFGFVEGEPVAVIARGAPGGDPLVVRIGSATIALRRAEARCVCVVAR